MGGQKPPTSFAGRFLVRLTVCYLLRSASGFSAAQLGLSSDKIVVADYDGEGRTNLTIFRDGLWAVLKCSNNLHRNQQFEQGSDTTVPSKFLEQTISLTQILVPFGIKIKLIHAKSPSTCKNQGIKN